MAQIIIAHGEDLDGIVSHAMLHPELPTGAKAACWQADVEHFFVTYSNIVEQFVEASGLVQLGDTVNIGDIAFEPNRMLDAITKIAQLAASVNYEDHHFSTSKNIALLRQMGIKVDYREDQCSSKIIASRFPKNRYYQMLADLAQRSDYSSAGRQTLLGKKLEKIIALASGTGNEEELLRITLGLNANTLIVSPDRLDDESEEKVLSYDIMAKEAFKTLRNYSEVKEFGPYKVLFAPVPALIEGKVALDTLADYGNHDMVMALYLSPKQSHWFLMKGRLTPYAQQFAAFMHGGGRGNGGGFRWEESMTLNNYPRIRDHIVDRVEYFLATVDASHRA